MKTRTEIIKRVIEDISCNHFIYICTTIERYLDLGLGVFDVFPELLDYKPENKNKNGAWWYADEDGKISRIKVLNELLLRINEDERIIKRNQRSIQTTSKEILLWKDNIWLSLLQSD